MLILNKSSGGSSETQVVLVFSHCSNEFLHMQGLETAVLYPTLPRVRSLRRLGWFVCCRSHKADIKVLSGLLIWRLSGENLPVSFMLLAGFNSVCR